MRILILEIDAGSANWLPHKLSSAGFEVRISNDVETSLADGLLDHVDGIIIETGHFAMASRPIVVKLRAEGISQPIMVIAGQSNWRETVANLDAGADGFIVKPVRSDEIAARMRAAIRRANGSPSNQMTVGRFAFDLNSKAVWLDGQMLDVTRNEFRLLRLFLLKPDSVFSAEQIRDALVQHDRTVSPNALEVQIARLRKKLGGDLIKTVRGVGYRINSNALFLECPGAATPRQDAALLQYA